MNFYRRKLPHWQPAGAQYFITFRLADSLPRYVMEELRKLREEFRKRNEPDDSYKRKTFQREIFKKYEKALDEGSTGPTWLKNPTVANIIEDAMHYRDSKEYDLYAYCIMSNHVHIVFEHLEKDFLEDSKKEYPITDILRELKRYSAYESNKILNRTGAFWKPESYDRVIRDEDELENTIRYTLNNPVKAGLIDHWEEWPHTYCKPEFVDTFS